MFGYFNNSSIRKYTVLMGELFNNINVVRERNGKKYLQKVPITLSNKEKFINALHKINNNVESNVAKVETILPRLRLNLIDMAYSTEYKTTILNRQIKARDVKSVSLYNPVPYKLTYELGIYTRHESDVLNIVEQIVPYFQPHFCCNIKEIIEDEVIKRDVNVTLTGIMMDEDADGSPMDRRRIEWTLTFDVIAWLYPPIDVISGQIKTIYLDFTANEKELGDGENMESVILKVEPEDVTQEDWDGSYKEERT